MKTRIHLLLLALITSVCSVWAQQPATWSDVSTTNSSSITTNPSADAIGGANNPYEISDVDDLKKLANIINGEKGYAQGNLIGVNFKLTTDIDLENQPWKPIGTYASDGGIGLSFCGNFDGNGYSIYNLYLNDYILGANYHYAGLFGLTSYSTIKNLGVHGEANITSGNNNLRVGLLAGTSEGGTIENCYAIGSVTLNGNTRSGQHVGLLLGYNPEKGAARSTVKNCYAIGSINFSTSSTNMTHVGGLVGRNRQSTIDGCYADVDFTITGTPASVGSLLGYTEGSGSRPYSINNSYGSNSPYVDKVNDSNGIVNVLSIDNIDNDLGNLSSAVWKIPGIPGHYPYLNDVFEDSGSLVEVELNFNGGHITSTSIGNTVSVKTNKGNKITLPDVSDITPPTGYTGQGWHTGSEASYAPFAGTEITSSTGVLTARYSADVTLHYHNGTNYGTGSHAIYYNEIPTTLPTTTPSTGYTLEGWYTTNTYSGSPLSTTAKYTTAPPASALYAKYNGTITVYYFHSGAYTSENETVVYNQPLATTDLPDLATDKPTGYDNGTWTVGSIGGANFTDITAFTEDLTTAYELYAKYTGRISLHYYKNNLYLERSFGELLDVVYNLPLPTLPDLTINKPAGYNDGTWTVGDIGGITYSAIIMTIDPTGYELWANYTATIALDANNGELAAGVTSPITITYNSPLVFNDPTRDEHTFEGWSLGGSSSLYSKGSNFAELLGTSPTLVAQWKYILPQYIVWIESIEGITVDRATETEHKVEEGYDFKFFVTADEKYSDHHLTTWVNGEQIYPYRDDYFRFYYLIWDIEEDKNVVFKLTKDATSNSLLDATNISTATGTISVEVPKTTAVQIVSISGNVVFDSEVNGAIKAYVPAGIYVVVADGKSTKVVVR